MTQIKDLSSIKQKGRLVVVEQTIHQVLGDQPTIVPDSRYQRWLDSDEKPYLRTLRVGEEWSRLDCGWVEELPSLIVVQNLEGRFNVVPTEEEREAVNEKVIELGMLGVDAPFVRIRPSESCRFEPAQLPIMLRSKSGVSKVAIAVFPN